MDAYIKLVQNLVKDFELFELTKVPPRRTHYVIKDGKLHQWTTSKVLLKCIAGNKTRLVLAEHTKVQQEIIRGLYWPKMNTDFETYEKHCDMCQRHASNIHHQTELLQTTTAPYPFMRWVLTDYFTKWIEAESFVQVTDKEVQGFVWKNIIC
ncbi:hypothetical protein N665_0132s0007 [Sinapis alba]|nr:hypothetical protein N665_0132s0007 [Sinapis alba]